MSFSPCCWMHRVLCWQDAAISANVELLLMVCERVVCPAQLAQLRSEAPGFVAASLLDDSVVALPLTVPAPAPPAAPAPSAGATGSAAPPVAETLPAKGPARRSWPIRLQVRRHKPGCLQTCLPCGMPNVLWNCVSMPSDSSAALLGTAAAGLLEGVIFSGNHGASLSGRGQCRTLVCSARRYLAWQA